MAEGGFRLAGAYVEVNLRDNTSGDEQRIRAKLEASGPVDFETALRDPQNVAAVKKAIEASPAVELDSTLDKPENMAGVRKYIEGLPPAKIHTEVETDSRTATSARRAGEKTGEELGKGVGEGVRRSREPEKATEQVAKRAQAKFEGMQFAALFAGLPAAAAVAGAGVAAGLGAVPIVFAAIAASALSSNQEVGHAWSQLGSDLQAEAGRTGGVMSDEFIRASDKIGQTARDLEPQLASAMIASSASVDILSTGVTRLARNAMPGLVIAAQNSQAPMRGLSSLLEQSGTGATLFFTNLATGAEGTERSLVTTGGIVRDFAAFAGTLFANLANNGNPALGQFRISLQQIEGAATSATAAGSPLYGFVSGFVGTVSGGLGVIRGFVALLNLLPSGVAQFGGSIFAATRILQIFGVQAGAAFSGLGAKVSAAEGAGGKLKAGLGGLVAGGLSPAGIAVGVLSLGLSALAGEQQEAAAATAKHEAQQATFRQALEASNGVIDESVRSSAAKAAQDRGALSNVQALGLSTGKYVEAITQGGGALSTFTAQMRSATVSQLDAAGVGGVLKNQLVNAQDQLVKTGGAAADYDYIIRDAGKSMQSHTGASNEARVSWENQLTAMLNLAGQTNELEGDFNGEKAAQQAAAAAARDGATAHEQAAAAADAQRQAIVNLANEMLAQTDKELGLRQATYQQADAQKAATQALKAHGASSKEYRDAALQRDQADQALIRSAGELAAQEAKAKGVTDTATISMEASTRAALELAAKYGTNVPLSLRRTITSMSDTQLEAAGVTRSVDGAGNAVYRLPGGKTIKLDVNEDGAMRGIAAVRGALDRFRDKTVYLTTVRRTVQQGPTASSALGAAVASAHGNLLKPSRIAAFAGGGFANLTPMSGALATVVPPNTWRVVGDNMRFPEVYAPLDGSRRTKSLLAAAVAHEGGGSGGGAPAVGGGPSRVEQHFHIHPGPDASPRDIAALVSAEVGWQMRGK